MILFTDMDEGYFRLTETIEVSCSTLEKASDLTQMTNRGYGSVNSWGGIFGGMKSPLVRINGRLTLEILVTFLKHMLCL